MPNNEFTAETQRTQSYAELNRITTYARLLFLGRFRVRPQG